MRIITLSEAVKRVEGGTHFELAIKEFIDAALTVKEKRDVAVLVQDDPPLIVSGEPGDPQDLYNVIVAGLACEIAYYFGFTMPNWVLGEHRSLETPFYTSPNKSVREIYFMTTPAPYRQRNLFCGEILNQALKMQGS